MPTKNREGKAVGAPKRMTLTKETIAAATYEAEGEKTKDCDDGGRTKKGPGCPG